MAVTATSGPTSTPPAASTHLETTGSNKTSASRGAPRPSHAAVSAWSCLLLSEIDQRRDALRQSAEAAGWEPIVCASIGQAVQESERWRTQLAIVDLGSMAAVQKATFLTFAERLAARDRLLLVCDEPTSADAEIHARQAGAWLYVPAPEFGEGLTELLGEALAAAHKLSDRDAVGV